MGNRSITYFYDGSAFSCGIYQQWNSGRIFYYAKHACLRTGCAEGSAARFVAECCKRNPGNLGVFIFGPPEADVQAAMLTLLRLPKNKNAIKIVHDSFPDDGGIYIIDVSNRNKKGILVWQVSDYFENRKTRSDFTRLSCAQESEYLDSPECRLIGTLPAREDTSGSKPKQVPRTKVDSRVINSFAVTHKGNLLVEFQNGKVYRYYDVDKYTVLRLQAAESKGKYFNHHIKYNFPYKEVSQIPKTFKN